MRAYPLLLAGLIASGVAGSAWAQSAAGGSTAGIDVNGATGGNRGAPAGFDTGLKSGYSFQGSGLPGSASSLPSLGAPPPSSAIGNGPPGPPGRPTAGTTAPQ